MATKEEILKLKDTIDCRELIIMHGINFKWQNISCLKPSHYILSNVLKGAKNLLLPEDYVNVKKIFEIIVNDSTQLEQEKINSKLKTKLN